LRSAAALSLKHHPQVAIGGDALKILSEPSGKIGPVDGIISASIRIRAKRRGILPALVGIDEIGFKTRCKIIGDRSGTNRRGGCGDLRRRGRRRWRAPRRTCLQREGRQAGDKRRHNESRRFHLHLRLHLATDHATASTSVQHRNGKSSRARTPPKRCPDAMAAHPHDKRGIFR
jgi:hypothetical protein